MDFAINTNLSAFQVYDSLAKINTNTQKAQLRLATMKKINSVADDTSGFKVGTTLQGQNAVKKADLNNVSSATNYVSTAESSLQLINEKLNQISAKYQDSLDPLKSKTSIAKDINALADEIDSILKNTKINGNNLLAQDDGTELAGNAVFGVGGDVTMDFASSSYLKVDDLNAVLNGGAVADPGQESINSDITNGNDPYTGGNQTSIIHAEFADGTSNDYSIAITDTSTIGDLFNVLEDNMFADNFLAISGVYIPFDGSVTITVAHRDLTNWAYISNITSLETTSGYDITGALGITKHSSASAGAGGLRASDADTVLAAASNLTDVTNNVKAALGRIGNISQTLESRNEFLTSSIANNTALISKIFDADMAMEQLNATKGSIGGQVGISMLSQVNAAPQQLLSLFR
ncbi:MAG: flagellin [Ignavibacteriaceae bacterium]